MTCPNCETSRKKKDQAIEREVATTRKLRELEDLNAALKETNANLRAKLK